MRDPDPIFVIDKKIENLDERIGKLEAKSRHQISTVLSGEFWRKLGTYVIVPLSLALVIGGPLMTCTTSFKDSSEQDSQSVRDQRRCQHACVSIGLSGFETLREYYQRDVDRDGHQGVRCTCVGARGKMMRYDDNYRRLVLISPEKDEHGEDHHDL